MSHYEFPGQLVWTTAAPPSGTVIAAISNAGTVMTSPDAITWTQQTAPVANPWTQVSWSPTLNLFAACASSGTGRFMYSNSTGTTWTSGTDPATAESWVGGGWLDGPGLFVFGAAAATNGACSSSDGITYTNHNFQASSPGNVLGSPNVAWSSSLGRGVYVGSISGQTTTDGTTWSIDGSAGGNSIVWGPALGIFVLASNSSGVMRWSTNGTSWTAVSGVGTATWRGVAYTTASTYFVAVGSAGNNAYSTDGKAWTVNSAVTGTPSFTCLTYSTALDLFIAGTSTGAIYTSPDGFTWTSQTSALATNINSIAASG